MNRPFEGAYALSCPCFTEQAERKLYGKQAVFICDPNNATNRPVKGMHNNVLRRWPLFPKLLREAFCSTFSHEAIIDPSKRVMAIQWQRIILQTRAMYVKCPHCGKYTFIDPDQPSNKCIECGHDIQKCAYLKIGKYKLPLVPEQNIYLAMLTTGVGEVDIEEFAGIVVRNANKPSIWGLRNTSNVQWTVTTPNGEQHLVDSGKGMPIQPGTKIRFSRDGSGEICV